MSEPLRDATMSNAADAATDAAATTSSTPDAILLPGGGEGMTNKEKRKAIQAAKRAAREGKATLSKSSSAADSPVSTTAATTTSKRKRAAADEGVKVDADGEAPEEAAEGESEGEAEAEAEVEALSHKELRRRKKLEEKAKIEGKAAPAFTTGKGANAAAGATGAGAPIKRSPWCIWVANMRFSTDEQRLKLWLEDMGLEGISRVHMPKGPKKDEHNKGFAYVDLPSAEMVEKAIGLSESRLDGRNLLIKSGNDFQGRPALNASAASLAMSALGTGPPPSSASAASGPNAVSAAGAAGLGEEANDHVAFSALPASIKGKTGLTKTARKMLRSQKNPPGPTLFIGNLSFESTEEGIRSLLENSAKRREEWRKADKEEKKQQRKRADAAAGGSSSDEDAPDSDDDASSSSSSSSSFSDESEDEAAAASVRKTSVSTTKANSDGRIRGAGIRKVRMGTFQDTGKCKGFAFVDFHTPAHATATLIDGRNSHLDGRTIILQYAGADAIRRGAPKGTVTGGPRPFAPTAKRHKETKEERMARRTAAAAAGGRGRGRAEGGRGLESKRRAKPGAALANAQRENMGIVASEGKKTTFE